MAKKKKKKKHHNEEEKSLLKMIDQDIISQYYSIKEDAERFQYQLIHADQKTRKKYKKALKNGKPFSFTDNDSVKARKKILKEMENDDFLVRAEKLCNDFAPILKLLGRCLALLIVAILSVDSVKATASKETMSRLDRIFKIAMSV